MPKEIQRLREIIKVSQEEVDGEVLINWNIVSDRFGPNRTKHQILCKAVELGLKSETPLLLQDSSPHQLRDVMSSLDRTDWQAQLPL